MDPLTEQLKAEAIRLGFDAVGITTADPIPAEDADLLRNWLQAGCPEDLSYMRRNLDKRIAAALLPGARSVVCVLLRYGRTPERLPRPAQAGPWGRVADYAIYPDYHTFMRSRLHQLAAWLADRASVGRFRYKACVDSAPLAERSLARRAGLGFIGRNRCLIHPRLGAKVLLGELVTTQPLAPDEPLGTSCDDCGRCIRACPTGALSPHGFDARRCIGYLTIERRGPIDAELAAAMGDSIFGCDRCMEACPHERQAPEVDHADWPPHADRKWLDARWAVNCTQEELDRRFAGTPLHRPGLHALQRNARIVVHNAGERSISD